MTDLFLFPVAGSPSDVTLRDPLTPEAGFDPATGFPYIQSADPVRTPVRATAALMMAACVFGAPPVPYDPASAGHPYPSYPDQTYAKRRNPAALSQQACAFTEPAEFDKALRFNAHADRLEATTSLPALAQSYSVKSFFYIPTGSPNQTRIIWSLEDGGVGFNHYLAVNASNQLFWLDNNNSHAVGTVQKGVWYYAVFTLGPEAGGVGPGNIYWGRVGTAPTTDTGFNVGAGWTPAKFTIGSWLGTGEFMDGRISGVQLWAETISSGRAALEVDQLGPKNFLNLRLDFRLLSIASKLDGTATTSAQLTNPGGAGTWTEERGPFITYEPDRGHPYEQGPEPVRPIARALYQLPPFVPYIAPVFDPSTGFPYEQPSEPVRARPFSLAALGTTAFFYGTPPIAPPVFDPANGFPYEQSPGPVLQKPRAVAALGTPACVFAERGPHERAVQFLSTTTGRLLSSTVPPQAHTYSMAGWFFIENSQGVLLQLRSALGDNHRVSVGAVNPFQLGFTTNAGDTLLRYLTPRAWYYAALTVVDNPGSNPSITLYCRAEGESSFLSVNDPSSYSFAPNVPAELSIGGSDSFGSSLIGRSAHVRLWTRVLSSAELMAESLLSGPGSTPNLIAAYRLKDAATKTDAIRGATLTAPDGGSWGTQEGPLVEFDPRLSASDTTFPDSVPGPKRPLNEGQFEFVYAAPVSFNPGNGYPYPSYPDFAYGPKRLVREGLVAFDNIDFMPKLAWSPTFADFARAPRRPVNEGGAFFVKVEREPDLDWLSSWPDFPGRAARRPVNEGFNAFVKVEREPDLDWSPDYPDFAYGPKRPVSEGFNAFDNIDFMPKLAWSPTFPEFARAPKRSVNEGGLSWAYFEREPDLDWSPTFPDFARGPKPLVATGVTAQNVLPILPYIVPETSWLPSYPDFARAPKRPVDIGSAPMFVSVGLARAPQLEWLAHFEDFARGPKRPVATGHIAFVKVEREPDLDWSPDFPDFARGRRPVNEGGAFFVKVEREPDLDWSPTFPEFARAPKRPVNEGGLFFVKLEREPDVDWSPDYPDFAYGPKRAVNEGLHAFVNTEREPQLDWTPDFPDSAPGPKRPVSEGFNAFVKLEREPDLDWSPTFVDFARAPRRPVNEGGAVFVNTEREPSLDWSPEFADFARAARRPVNTGGAVLGTRVPSLDWLSTFPASAPGPRRPVREGLFAFDNFDFTPRLSWSPTFPEFARAPKRPVNTGGGVYERAPRVPTVSEWLSITPDFARAPERPVNEGGLSFVKLERDPDLDWSPVTPDFARAARRPVNEGGLSWTHLEREPITDWSPTYPDFARSAAPRLQGHNSYIRYVFVPVGVTDLDGAIGFIREIDESVGTMQPVAESVATIVEMAEPTTVLRPTVEPVGLLVAISPTTGKIQ